jgi:flagellar FliL protein
MSKTAPAADAPAAEPKKKGKLKLIIGAVVLLAVGGGAASVLMKPPKAKTTLVAGQTAPTTTTLPSGPLEKFDDITLNLADGHYLKIGLALQLTKKAKPDDYVTGGAAAKAFDLTISTFGAKTYAQLAAPGGRDATKAVLQKAIIATYNGEVSAIYLTDFVMQ